jgi:DNA-3-methyladenine glycosylase I
MATKTRCKWCGTDPLYVEYHDKEWGVPVRDDRKLFEFLILEGAQAGLSWETILKKRDNYRQVFYDFNASRIARLNAKQIETILTNPGIIRNRLKVNSTVGNAKAFLKVREEFDTFDNYIWQFTGGTVKQNTWRSMKEVPAKTAESDIMSKDLLKRGFKFVGSTICYAFMQAVGMVNDHLVTCPRHKAVQQLAKRIAR